MKALTTIILLILISSCTHERIVVQTKIKPADSCMTNKQYRQYLNFVRDSMKIEANTKKTEIKYEYKIKHDSILLTKYVTKFDTKKFNDSLTTIKRMYADSLKSSVKTTKITESTKQTEIKQANKTERTKARSLWWVWFCVGALSVKLLEYIIIILKAYINFPLKNR